MSAPEAKTPFAPGASPAGVPERISTFGYCSRCAQTACSSSTMDWSIALRTSGRSSRACSRSPRSWTTNVPKPDASRRGPPSSVLAEGADDAAASPAAVASPEAVLVSVIRLPQ
ncbi:hypothetical protein GCM10027449_19150 [Sinomonas notoginsengisoli]